MYRPGCQCNICCQEIEPRYRNSYRGDFNENGNSIDECDSNGRRIVRKTYQKNLDECDSNGRRIVRKTYQKNLDEPSKMCDGQLT